MDCAASGPLPDDCIGCEEDLRSYQARYQVAGLLDYGLEGDVVGHKLIQVAGPKIVCAAGLILADGAEVGVAISIDHDPVQGGGAGVEVECKTAAVVQSVDVAQVVAAPQLQLWGQLCTQILTEVAKEVLTSSKSQSNVWFP